MNTGTFLFPESASTMASRVDALYFFLLAVSIFFSLLIAGLIVSFAVKFHRRRDEQVGAQIHGGMALELTWTIVPFVIVMVIFVWGAAVYFAMARPPDETLNVYVVGKQWMWKFQHLDGQREINELHVPVGRPVKLIMTSEDVNPRSVFPGIPHQSRRHSRPLHLDLVSSDETGPVSPVLRRILRNEAFRNGRIGGRDGSE
jgi:heme/copper-type cytochrome/quinol oxidase subunit 2